MNNNGKTAKTAKKPKSPKNLTKKAYILWGILATCVLTVLVVVTTVLVSAIVYVKGDLVVNLDEYKANQNQTSFVYAYDKSGATVELARLHGEEDRVWVDLDDMSPYLKEAFIALEDTRFMKHHGVDWIRTFGVIIKPKNIGQGGSTITQQLIKNVTGNKEVTVQRKLIEIFQALEFEKKYDKDEILEWYLNAVYFGEGCDGIYTAAQKYFGKEPSQLTLAESASIVGIVNLPTYYSPFYSEENNKERQETVLRRMYELGFISYDEYKQAKDEELVFTRSENEVATQEIYSYYVEAVIADVTEDLMEQKGISESAARQLLPRLLLPRPLHPGVRGQRLPRRRELPQAELHLAAAPERHGHHGPLHRRGEGHERRRGRKDGQPRPQPRHGRPARPRLFIQAPGGLRPGH